MIRTWHGGIVSIFLLYHQAEQSHCPLQVSIWDGPVVTAILPITWGTGIESCYETRDIMSTWQ